MINLNLFPESIHTEIAAAIEAVIPECKVYCDCDANSNNHLHLVIDKMVNRAITNVVCDACTVTNVKLQCGPDVTVEDWWSKGITYTTRSTGVWGAPCERESHMPWAAFVKEVAEAIIKVYRPEEN